MRVTRYIAAAVLSAGCQQAWDFLPRTHTVAQSPDGRYTAYVRQHLNPDPPDDHLYLAAAGQPARLLMDLAPDADWCRTIIWTRDSRTVAFLISDNRLVVFDAATARRIALLRLVEADGYPGSEAARDVSVSNDGRIVLERFKRPTRRLTTKAYGTIDAPVTSLTPGGNDLGRALAREVLQITLR